MSTVVEIHPHLAHLPVYRGLPVAWVAVWSAEKALPVQSRWTPTGVVGGLHTAKRHGVLWIETGTQAMGQGAPDFGSTSSGRQRRCMTVPRCQVCGRVIEGTPWWIIPMVADVIIPFGDHDETEEWTKQPPVCQVCSELAVQWCPALRHGGYDLFQATPTPVAVIGDEIRPGGTAIPETGCLLSSAEGLPFMVARELVVRLDMVPSTYRQVDPK